MNDTNVEPEFSCTECKAFVAEEDTFCPNCGALFTEGLMCTNHGSVAAQGVCVICEKPYCKECGAFADKVFVCDSDWRFELCEGMARVYGAFDNVQAQYVTTCLEQAQFHPFLYSRSKNPGPGMVSSWMMTRYRNFGRHPIVEFKVLVPYREVHAALKTLEELGLAVSGSRDGFRDMPVR